MRKRACLSVFLSSRSLSGNRESGIKTDSRESGNDALAILRQSTLKGSLPRLTVSHITNKGRGMEVLNV